MKAHDTLNWSVGIAIFILLAIAAMNVRAAPPANADRALAPWFESLVAPKSGLGCCSIADCRTTESRQMVDHYEVLIDERFPGVTDSKWVVVPEEAILPRTPNPTGRPVVCWVTGSIRCFVRGTDA